MVITKNKGLNVSRKVKSGIAAIVTSLWTAACGSTVNNYYGTEEEQPTGYENPCGNSPVFGKYLWEVGGCKLSLHMREDCKVGITSRDNNYEYPPAGTFEGADALPGQPGDSLTYDGLVMSVNNELPVAELRPDLRFIFNESEHPLWTQTELAEWTAVTAKINSALDRYHGMILMAGDADQYDRDDNAFIPLAMPYTSREECQASIYYAGF